MLFHETGVFDDPRKPENLLDGINNTTDDRHMWLIPFTPGGRHELRINLGSMCEVAGINIWNYNKSNEDTFRGVRLASISADGVLIGKQEFRIGPGCDGVPYKQRICFRDVRRNGAVELGTTSLRSRHFNLRQDYDPPFNPSGLQWKINIYSNWGDGYYVGMDELKFFDDQGRKLDILRLAAIVSRYNHVSFFNCLRTNTMLQ